MIDAFTWSVWALLEREPGRRLGFAKARPEHSSAPQHQLRVSDQDLLAAEQISIAMSAYTLEHPEAARQLRIWHGAYPGAPDRRAERVRKLGVPRNRAHELMAVRQAWVEGWIAAQKARRAS